MKIIINFICIYSRVKKNGLVPIYCVLKKGTEINRFSTKLSIQKNLWDASKNRASLYIFQGSKKYSIVKIIDDSIK